MRDDDHAGGLARDLPLLTRRNVMTGVGLLGLVAVSGHLLSGTAGLAEANQSAAGPDGAICVKDPVETGGPFPADGTNAKSGLTVNALIQSGVVRGDLRASFGGLSGLAEGVPLDLEILLKDVGAGCEALANHAIYLWHATADGKYSLYDLPDQNFLRGVVVTDATGCATVKTVFPGCYDGRWPHIHFEVFSTLQAAVSGKASLLISQFALPQGPSAAVYAADSQYPASAAHLRGQSLARDIVFGDNTAEQIAVQTIKLIGDPSTGFSGKVTVGVITG
ncbi:MAG: intradiol ring-cleavage dioxygenase [bacterium]